MYNKLINESSSQIIHKSCHAHEVLHRRVNEIELERGIKKVTEKDPEKESAGVHARKTETCRLM